MSHEAGRDALWHLSNPSDRVGNATNIRKHDKPVRTRATAATPRRARVTREGPFASRGDLASRAGVLR
jgi:hypothetical protein